jgi:hypothetical protein
MIKGTWLEPLAWWAYSAVAVTAVLGVTYVTVQQSYRTGLDDPQIQMAEDGAYKIYSGGVPADVVPRGIAPVDISQSLSPWIAVYDENGTVLESSGQLDNAPPQLPKGIFTDLAKQSATGVEPLRFTWQPRVGVRQAVVLEPTTLGGGMYVVAGRNMREVEQRIAREGEMVFAGWLITLVALLVAVYLYQWLLLRTYKK